MVRTILTRLGRTAEPPNQQATDRRSVAFQVPSDFSRAASTISIQ